MERDKRREAYHRILKENQERIERDMKIPEGWYRVTEGVTQLGDQRYVDWKGGSWLDVMSSTPASMLRPPGIGLPVEKLAVVIRRIT